MKRRVCLLLGLVCAGAAPLPAADAPTTDFDAKFAEVRVLHDNRQYLKLEQTLAALARLDGPRTLKAIESLEATAHERATQVVFGVWAKQDLRAALAWAKDDKKWLLERAEFIHACVVVRDISILDEVLVAAGVDKNFFRPSADPRVREPPDGYWTALRLGEEWAKVDPAPIIAWARGLTDRGFQSFTQQGALRGITRELARKSPDETWQWLETGIFFDPALDPARNGPRALYQAFAEAVIQTSGVEAAEAYFRQRPAHPDYRMAYQPLTEALAKTAPERVDAWIMAIADPSFRSSAASVPIRVLRDSRPDLAADLFVKYNFNPAQARSLTQLQSMLVTWAVKDAKAAIAFVENAPRITPEQRATLRAAIEPKP